MTISFIWLLVAGSVGFFVGRRFRKAHLLQNRGEMLVRQAIQLNFLSQSYHLMNNMTLRLKDGTTQIDHVLVSRFGVFVIETKHYNGWIFANPKQPKWTQMLAKQKFQFQNPSFQNFRHVLGVQSCLSFLPPQAVCSAVVFTGEAQFKTPMPENVFHLPSFVDYIRRQTVEVLSENSLHLAVGRLETMRLALTSKTDVEHVQDLQRRHCDPK